MKNRIKRKIAYLGFTVNYKVFIYMRLLSCLILFVFTLLCSNYGYILAPIITIIYYIFVEYAILDLAIKKRTKLLEKNALVLFPIFLISLKNKQNIKTALLESTSIVDNELARYFKQFFKYHNVAKTTNESLDLLRNNIPSSYINNILLSLKSNNISDIETTINDNLALLKQEQNRNLLHRYRLIPLKLALTSLVFVFFCLILLMLYKMFI